MTNTEIQAGYEKARSLYGDSYADYLIETDAEHAAKGIDIVPWPLSLQGNDGE